MLNFNVLKRGRLAISVLGSLHNPGGRARA